MKLEGSEGCAVLKIPGVRLLSGQFLVPVYLLDGEGVHRYQQYLMPENLIVRTDTRDLGLFRLDYAWEQRRCAPPPPKTTKPADGVESGR